MRPNDLEQVVAIEKASFSQPWSLKGFLEALGMEETLFVVAEEEAQKTILGYVCVYQSFDEGEITNVAVAEDARRKGIGEQLLGYVIQECIRAGIRRLVLEVRSSNFPAIHLYEKMGFHTAGCRRGFYELPKEDALIMIWEQQDGLTMEREKRC